MWLMGKNDKNKTDFPINFLMRERDDCERETGCLFPIFKSNNLNYRLDK